MKSKWFVHHGRKSTRSVLGRHYLNRWILRLYISCHKHMVTANIKRSCLGRSLTMIKEEHSS